MPLRILFVGDMHLGRRPSRLPEQLAPQTAKLGPAEAWRRTVELALDRQVDAVALAGDLVEREDDFFEAYRELSSGVKRLADSDIRVIGVAGNHDVQVLPRLVRQIPSFKLIGANGTWECETLDAGGEHLSVWGWSFPERHVSTSPLEGHHFNRHDGINLGLLHCDRDQSGSRYAPVSSAELTAAGVDGWLLGHIHAPDQMNGSNPSGYLGSVTGLDPGEPGDHGPWMLTIERGRIDSLEQQILAPLRWERLEVDIEGVSGPEEVKDRLLEGTRLLDNRLAELFLPPNAVGLRISLKGRTRFGETATAALGGEDRGEIMIGRGGTHYFIERLISVTRPEISLAELAHRNDPLGLLARRLLWLDAPSDDPHRIQLIDSARERLVAQSHQSAWSALDTKSADDEAIADWLRRAGFSLLDRMQAQEELPA